MAIHLDVPKAWRALHDAPLPIAHGASASFRFELQGSRVDAVPQTGRLRAVIEDVAQVAAAITALHLSALHPVTSVTFCFDRLVLSRRPETWPAGSGIKLLVGTKQDLTAAGTP